MSYMGNCKFRLADILPNTWFNKLMFGTIIKTDKKHQNPTPPPSPSSAATPSPQPPPHTNQRKSYHFTKNNAAASKKSSKKRRNTNRNTKQSSEIVNVTSRSSVSAGCNCRDTLETLWTKDPVGCPNSPTENSDPGGCPNSPIDRFSVSESLVARYGSERTLMPETLDGMISWAASYHCRVDSDFVIFDIENEPSNTKFHDLDEDFEFNLAPIVTKPSKFVDSENAIKRNEPTEIKRSPGKFEYGSFSEEVIKEPVRRSSSGVKLRTNSPRIRNKRIHGRKSVSCSSSKKGLPKNFAIVKTSKDPQKDFKESMMEMIVENDIFASKDLEDLLVCYLTLNADIYHDLIIKAFKQIWIDISVARMEIHPTLQL